MAMLNRDGPRANPQPTRRQEPGYCNAPQPPRAGNRQFTSENKDFPEPIKYTFRFIQTLHHAENCEIMPPRVEKAINKVVENIRPPAPGPEVTSQVSRAAVAFKMSITSAIQNHLQAQAEEFGAALRDVDNGDWKQAETLAKNRYDKRFGTRARSDTATEAIAALKPIFAKDWVKPKNGQSPLPCRKMAAPAFHWPTLRGRNG